MMSRSFYIVVISLSVLSCKARFDASQLKDDQAKKGLSQKADTAIGLLKSASPDAYEAALLFKSISLDAKYVRASNVESDINRVYNPYGPNGYQPYGGNGYSPYGQPGIFSGQNNKGFEAEVDNSSYTEGGVGEIATKNQGLINHFRSVQSLNDFGGSNSYSRARASLENWINNVDRKYPTKKHQTTNRTSIDYVGPNLFKNAVQLMNGNVFRAAAILADMGHDDFNGYGPSTDSNLYAIGVLGENVRVSQDAFQGWKKAQDRLNAAIPENGQDIGGAYNYQMIGGFYMGCQLSKLGLAPVKVNKTVIDTALVIALRQYYSKGSYDKCVTDFLDSKVCKTKTQSSQLFANVLGSFSKQYEFNLAEDLPALGGYYYKIITLEMRLQSSNMPEVMQLFKSGYINPFNEGFPKPQNMSQEVFEKAKLYLDARLVHVKYVMEQHRTGARFGAKVCSEYKAKVAGELNLNPDERKIYDMGFLQAGIKADHVKRRTDGPKRLGALLKDEKRLNATIQSLNKKLYDNNTKLDWIMPDVGIMERAIEVELKTHSGNDGFCPTPSNGNSNGEVAC